MRTKASLPTVTIVIISIVVMLIVTAVIFLAIPFLEDEYGDPGPCADTCYRTSGVITKKYIDCEHPNRMIIYYSEGAYGDQPDKRWQYMDNFEGFTSNAYVTLHDLRNAIHAYYEGGSLSEGSWHWFDCTAEAIS